MTRANALWVVCMVDLARSPPLTKTFSVDRLRPFVENLRPSKPPQPSVEGLKFSTKDRKSTRLNSSHGYISYAVFCLKKKKHTLFVRTDSETAASRIELLQLCIAAPHAQSI